MKNIFVLAALVTVAVPAAADENTVATGPGGNTIRQSGTKAISAGWAGGADSRANLLYGLSESTMLDLLVGVNVTRAIPTGQTERQTVFGIDIGLGYRMYAGHRPGKVHPYIEPLLRFRIDDFSEVGDTLAVGVGGQLGVDYMFDPQFSLGVNVGASLELTDHFEQVNFGLFTAGINATFWWN
jgi:hypothetical protein